MPYHLRRAELSGTLGEHDGPQASCHHGFASHGGVRLLYRDVLGLREARHPRREIVIRIPDVPLEWCEGTMPTPDGDIELRWRRDGDGAVIARLTLPPDGVITSRHPPPAPCAPSIVPSCGRPMQMGTSARWIGSGSQLDRGSHRRFAVTPCAGERRLQKHKLFRIISRLVGGERPAV